MILNRFHYSVFAKSAWHKNGGVSITPFSFVFISFVRTRFETEDVVHIVVVAFSKDSVFGVSIENHAFSDVSVFKSLHFEQRFRMTPFSVFPFKTMRFQMSLFSNHSTLNSVFKCLRFRSFSMETPTQKRRHSTPFSYENGVMETGPKTLIKS